MDTADQLRALAARVPSLRDTLQTEEATKNALIMPFIMALGYDVFNPSEVTPEIVADVGVKKGEKVDYAILMDSKPIILFECKKCGADLELAHASQLFRYFTVTAARFAILTNGINYRFFTDLESPNKMDDKPFLEFNLLDYRDSDIEELRKFTKSKFNVDNILATASELKYASAIERVIAEQFANPSEEFVRVITAQVYSGRMTPAVRSQFALLTKRAFQQFVNDRINQRLKVAMEGVETEGGADASAGNSTPNALSGNRDDQIITTSDEKEGFYVVRAILRELVPVSRIVMRDAQSYCAILLDDNNRKPICRLHFNSPKKKFVSVYGPNKEFIRIDISDISEIYQQSDALKNAVQMHLGGASTNSEQSGG